MSRNGAAFACFRASDARAELLAVQHLGKLVVEHAVLGDFRANPEAVIHGVTGLVSPRKDVAQFVANIRRLLDDPDRARQMGRAGRERYRERFRVDRFTAEMERVYQELLPELASR